MRPPVIRWWLLLPLASACAAAPPAPTTEAPVAAVLAPPTQRAPPLPEPPAMFVTPASASADRMLPGPCRLRTVEAFGSASPEIGVSRLRYDGDRLREIESVDAGGGFLYRGDPKFDADGRMVELSEKETSRKLLATRTYRWDGAGHLTAETYAKAGEKKPSFERTVAYDATGRIASETWRWGSVSWKLTPGYGRSALPDTLAREDGTVAVRYLRDRAGNVLMESRQAPAGTETRLISEYGCFGVDDSPQARLSELCESDAGACVSLSRLLSEEAHALGLAPDPALADAYRSRACVGGDAESCMAMAGTDRDPERAAGYRHHALNLSRSACNGGDARSCQHACELGDPDSCKRIASDE